jgi:hypothetical protein
LSAVPRHELRGGAGRVTGDARSQRDDEAPADDRGAGLVSRSRGDRWDDRDTGQDEEESGDRGAGARQGEDEELPAVDGSNVE